MDMFKEENVLLRFAFQQWTQNVLEQIKSTVWNPISTQEKREPSKWQQGWKREVGFARSFQDKIGLLLRIREGERLRMTPSRFISGSLARW